MSSFTIAQEARLCSLVMSSVRGEGSNELPQAQCADRAELDRP